MNVKWNDKYPKRRSLEIEYMFNKRAIKAYSNLIKKLRHKCKSVRGSVAQLAGSKRKLMDRQSEIDKQLENYRWGSK